MSVHRVRSSSTQETPTHVVLRPQVTTPPPVKPAPPRVDGRAPARRKKRIDGFLVLLWTVLILGLAGVSFVVYAVIFGSIG